MGLIRPDSFPFFYFSGEGDFPDDSLKVMTGQSCSQDLPLVLNGHGPPHVTRLAIRWRKPGFARLAISTSKGLETVFNLSYIQQPSSSIYPPNAPVAKTKQKK